MSDWKGPQEINLARTRWWDGTKVVECERRD